VIKSLALLVGGTAALWLLAAYPAHLLGGETGLVYSGAAALLCLVPTTLTLFWCQWALKGPPEQQLLAVMGGTVVRLLAVLGAAVALYLNVPYLNSQGFMLWVIVFYLITLTLEVSLLVARHVPAGQTPGR
jgi:hypothetical protein